MILQGQERNQTHLFTTYEDMISSANPVRIIDFIVTKLIEENPSSFDYKGKSHEGRPAYPFSSMINLYIYGMINRIKSTRALEKECHRNIELMWLMRGLKPDFKTISNFRSEQGAIISKFSKDFRRKLKLLGYINKEFAVDGSKFKANASRELITRKEVFNQMSDMNKDLQEYFKLLDAADKGEEIEIMEKNLLLEKIQSMEMKIASLNHYISEMDKQNKNYLSLTDMDCNLMRSRDGNIPAYNVQIAVDSNSGFIGAEYVTNAANDINELPNIVCSLVEELNIEEITTLSDCGYTNLDDIDKLQHSGTVTCYSALPAESRDANFKYNAERDVFTCPEGKEMSRKGLKKGRGTSQIIKYRGSECDTCPQKGKCTSSPNGRQVQRYTNQEFRDNYRTKMQEILSKTKIKKRREVVECVFGSLKIMGGKIPILTRGLKKVATEIKLYTLSYNFKHLLGMITLSELMEQWILVSEKCRKCLVSFFNCRVLSILVFNKPNILHNAS